MSTNPGPHPPKLVPLPSLSLGPLDKGGHGCPHIASSFPQATNSPRNSSRGLSQQQPRPCQSASCPQGGDRLPTAAIAAESRSDHSPALVPGGCGTAAPALTSNTSSSRIRVPNTMMPLTSITGWSLRSRCLVVFFLQSRTKVTFFLRILRAILCHLQRNSPGGGGGLCHRATQGTCHKLLCPAWARWGWAAPSPASAIRPGCPRAGRRHSPASCEPEARGKLQAAGEAGLCWEVVGGTDVRFAVRNTGTTSRRGSKIRHTASDALAAEELTFKLPGFRYAPRREFWKDSSFFFFKSFAPTSSVSVSLRIS